MSLEHMENYGQYGVGQQARMLNGVWAGVTNSVLLADPDPSATPGSVVAWLNGAQSELRYVLGAGRTKVGMACRIWIPEIPDSVLRIPEPFLFKNASNVTFLAVHISPTGSMLIKNEVTEAATLLAQTAGPVITANAWWHFEIWLTLNGTSADLEIRREGITVLDVNLPTVTTPQCYQVSHYATRDSIFVNAMPMGIKDTVIMNGLGSYNNDFIGSVSVFLLSTTSDVALNWTPSTGTEGWSILDNVPAVDTTYLSAGTPAPSPYIGGLSDLPDDVTSVKAVMTQVRAQKVDGGDGNLQNGIISNAAVGLGADRPITAAMTYWRDIFETDPDTGDPFLPPAVDALQFRMNRTV